jgi:hypothetical protein
MKSKRHTRVYFLHSSKLAVATKLQRRLDARWKRRWVSTIARSKEALLSTRFCGPMNRSAASSDTHVAVACRTYVPVLSWTKIHHISSMNRGITTDPPPSDQHPRSRASTLPMPSGAMNNDGFQRKHWETYLAGSKERWEDQVADLKDRQAHLPLTLRSRRESRRRCVWVEFRKIYLLGRCFHPTTHHNRKSINLTIKEEKCPDACKMHLIFVVY